MQVSPKSMFVSVAVATKATTIAKTGVVMTTVGTLVGTADAEIPAVRTAPRSSFAEQAELTASVEVTSFA